MKLKYLDVRATRKALGRFDECTSDEERILKLCKVNKIKPAMIEATHCNFHGYSDAEPFEIVRVISEKTIEIRAMDAELDESWKPNTEVGGFSGHTTNNWSQKWNITSNKNREVIRCRLGKRGWKSSHGFHQLCNEPYKFYDYNF